MQPKSISSTSNATIKDATRLKRKRHRYESRRFLAEGEDLLDIALERGVIPRQVFVLEGYEDLVLGEAVAARMALRPKPQTPPAEVYICSRVVMEKLSELGGGSRLIAVFEMLDRKFPAGLDSSSPMIYLAGAGDPGNVGTILRAAAAFEVSAVILGPGTADPYSPKALRATMGAIFQVPFFLTVNPETLVSWAEQAAVRIICADAHAGEPVWKAPLAGSFVLVVGPERDGIPRRLVEAAAATVHIPQGEGAESINLAMAATVILYEALRQRSPGRG